MDQILVSSTIRSSFPVFKPVCWTNHTLWLQFMPNITDKRSETVPSSNFPPRVSSHLWYLLQLRLPNLTFGSGVYMTLSLYIVSHRPSVMQIRLWPKGISFKSLFPTLNLQNESTLWLNLFTIPFLLIAYLTFLSLFIYLLLW